MAEKRNTNRRTPAKSSNTAKKKTTSKNASKNNAPEKGGLNPQVQAILLLAGAVLLFALAIFPGQAFWATLRGFMYGVFGFGFILIHFTTKGQKGNSFSCYLLFFFMHAFFSFREFSYIFTLFRKIN